MRFLLILTILPLYCHGNLCPKGEYWSTFSEICLKCTQCKSHQIVIRNCQSHKDTLCSSTASIKKQSVSHNNNNNNWENSNKNKKVHHFDEARLHFITDDATAEDLLDNTLPYPSLKLGNKHGLDNTHKHHLSGHNDEDVKKPDVKKHRINDKFLKWDKEVTDNDDEEEEEEEDDDDDDEEDDDDDYYDEDDDYDYDYKVKKHQRHKVNKVTHKKNQATHNKVHHHYSFSDSSDENDNDEYDENQNNLDAILNKNSKNKWNSKRWKDDIVKAHHKEHKNKKAERLAKLNDERKLEEWLVQSRKQFKDRKDNLLKTLKEEQLDSYGSDKRLRLNYPLFNAKDGLNDKVRYNKKNNDMNKPQRIHKMGSDVELFKELIKNEKSQEMELATLMSNKKESPFHYKPVTPSYRLYLGEPSSSNIGGQIKDPQEVIKEEMGGNIINEKSKFRVVPIIDHDNNEEIIQIPFTAAERLVWDWQAVAVVSAIAACLLFFLVIGTFVLVNARHCRREKPVYKPDCEELSTRVALIQPNLETSAAEGNNTNRFLQQFLSLNEDTVKETKHKINREEFNKS